VGLFTGARVRNYTVFCGLHNIYQRRVGNIHSSLALESGIIRILWIAQYLPMSKLEIFIVHWCQSQKLYHILWIAQYLPTLELEIFISKYSMMPKLGIL